MSNDGYHGHMTLTDGTHVPLSKDEAAALWKKCEDRDAARALKLPTEQSAIDAMFEAYDRLRQFGWSDAIYCPKDGSTFDVIEPGSTGIHKCHYEGKWPKGTWWVSADGDQWPSRPVLYRKINDSDIGG
jgi:hypothetical protein